MISSDGNFYVYGCLSVCVSVGVCVWECLSVRECMTVSVWFCLCVCVGQYLSGYLGVIVFEWEKMRDSVNECLYISSLIYTGSNKDTRSK